MMIIPQIMGLPSHTTYREEQNFTPSDELHAWIDRLTAEGFEHPSIANQEALDGLVAVLKSSGAWDNAIDYIGIQAQDGGSVNPCRVNLKNPGDPLGGVYNALGFTNKIGTNGNGQDAYLDTMYNPSSYAGHWNLNNAGILVYMQAASGEGAFVGGDFADVSIRRRSLTIHRVNSGTNVLNSAFNFDSTPGVKAMYRISANEVKLYNGKVGSSRTQNSFQVRSMNMLLHKDFGTFGAHTLGLVILGASLEEYHDQIVDAVESYIDTVASL